jgi:protein phosphatase
MNYQFFGLTHPGRVRTNNEDAVAFDAEYGVAVLADGMGGYNAGEVASGMATTFIKAEMVRWLSQLPQPAKPLAIARALEICADKANQSILHASDTNPQYAGMGTTLMAGVFQGGHVVLGHVGDSRCYRLRQGALSRLTKDHSMLQEQVDAGLISASEAATAPGKNLLTRALGVDDGAPIDTQVVAVEPGDLFLMCSDGLTDMLPDEQLLQLLQIHEPLPAKGQVLVERANAQGGRDNIAVLLIQAVANPGLVSRWFKKSA